MRKRYEDYLTFTLSVTLMSWSVHLSFLCPCMRHTIRPPQLFTSRSCACYLSTTLRTPYSTTVASFFPISVTPSYSTVALSSLFLTSSWVDPLAVTPYTSIWGERESGCRFAWWEVSFLFCINITRESMESGRLWFRWYHNIRNESARRSWTTISIQV